MTGTITDKSTGEPIYNVGVFASNAQGVIGDPPTGTTTNFDGIYAFTPNTGFITFKHVGYQTRTIPVPFGGNTINVTMQAGHELPTVEITYDNRPWYKKYQLHMGIGAAALAIGVAGYYATKKDK
jgi:hypothetical protein